MCMCLCRAHMQDLQEITHEVHYENYRSEKMAEGGTARKIKCVDSHTRVENDSRSAARFTKYLTIYHTIILIASVL